PLAPRLRKGDVTHGQRRGDDYFWLRDKASPEVRAYLEAENRHTESVMAPTRPLQETLYREMLDRLQETHYRVMCALIQWSDLSVPFKDGGYFYYSRTEEGKQYPILCRRKGALTAPEEATAEVNAAAGGRELTAV